MKIKINGEELLINPGISVFDYITVERNLKQEHVVIEYNGEILKKDKWKETFLKEDDELEVVSFVGGG